MTAEAVDGSLATTRPRADRPAVIGEIAVVAVLVLVYDRIRDVSGPRRGLAVTDGRGILAVERTLHLDMEHWANRALEGSALAPWAGWYYQLAHLTVTLLVLLWVYVRRVGDYRQARTALVGINLVGLLVFWVLPVAPPRLLPGRGFVDVAVSSGVTGRTTTVSPDLYAAMPSLHVAWAVWVALQVLLLSRSRPLRALAVGHAVLTSAVVLATANHYVLDVVAGVAVSVVVTGLSRRVGGGRRARLPAATSSGPESGDRQACAARAPRPATASRPR